VPIDDQITPAVDRALAETHGQLGQRLRALADEVTRIVLEDIQQRETTSTVAPAVDPAPPAPAATGDESLLRIAAAINALDEADSLRAILDTLAAHAGREVDRSALLLVKGELIQGWRFTGFNGLTPIARSITLERDADSILSRAIRTGADAPDGARAPEEEEGLPAFARGAGARQAAAFPIVVGGVAIGVLYGDAPMDVPDPDGWRAALTVLTRHAGRVLEAVTLRHALGLEPSDPSSPQPASGEAWEQME
jgi:hypothetical protein